MPDKNERMAETTMTTAPAVNTEATAVVAPKMTGKTGMSAAAMYADGAPKKR